MALATYLGLAGLFFRISRSDIESGRNLLKLGAVGLLGSLLFSAYMFVISAFRLETFCLLCMGLYTVSLTNTGLLFATLRASKRTTGLAPLRMAEGIATVVSGIVALSVLAWFTWPVESGPISKDIRTAADVEAADPEFYKWYSTLPKVDPATLVREDQKPLTRNGKVPIIDFFDVECAHCKRNYFIVKQLVAERGGQIQIIHRHFPLDASCNDVVPASIHPGACQAAEAVECAGLQGKHDEMLDIMFEHQGQLFAENLPRLAGKIGLDKEKLQRCLDEHTTLPLILADARAGAKLDITSTPTVFIGGRRMTGALDGLAKYEMAVVVEDSASH